MHIATNTTTVWHSYTKVKAGKCYGIITKRVEGVVALEIKQVFATRKDAKTISNNVCQQLAKEQTA